MPRKVYIDDAVYYQALDNFVSASGKSTRWMKFLGLTEIQLCDCGNWFGYNFWPKTAHRIEAMAGPYYATVYQAWLIKEHDKHLAKRRKDYKLRKQHGSRLSPTQGS